MNIEILNYRTNYKYVTMKQPIRMNITYLSDLSVHRWKYFIEGRNVIELNTPFEARLTVWSSFCRLNILCSCTCTCVWFVCVVIVFFLYFFFVSFCSFSIWRGVCLCTRDVCVYRFQRARARAFSGKVNQWKDSFPRGRWK